jgi:hypothetical protein
MFAAAGAAALCLPNILGLKGGVFGRVNVKGGNKAESIPDPIYFPGR